MGNPARQSWLAYTRDLAERLGLRDWRVAVSDDPPEDPGATASIECVEGRRLAILRLSDQFLAGRPAAQRQTMTHELIHCHLAPLDQVMMAAGLSDPWVRVILEYAIDGLAAAVAPMLPLPPSAGPPELDPAWHANGPLVVGTMGSADPAKWM
jgi:hypothetical protein